MRFATLAIGLAAIILTAACSKSPTSGEPPSSAASPAAATSPVPAAMTDADKKSLLSTLPAAYQAANLDNGQSKLALCKACHTLGQGGEAGVGPNLWGVFGRRSGSQPGFAYSDGMKALGVTWDADRINIWITKPSAMVPGTKMTYAGMESPTDRVDVIAALKIATSAPPK